MKVYQVWKKYSLNDDNFNIIILDDLMEHIVKR